MATGEAKQAQQLDSVTDVVQEQEVDIAKAQQALSSFSSNQIQAASNCDTGIAFAQEDIDLIVSELEVTEEMAQKTLRQVAQDLPEGETLVVAALRKLVTMM
ncbi:hypothetical protein FisN_6Lh293 [Fistulifera solaris]|uniref:Nascent polypeptide-associated complex subunit alpha-like UBA domain-containing protein n=1 Tax=Fistulifera solaris TaxID=1519565 RepID=A0A1Z5J683_FISSO|nr:hypothetical protein FisN_6Lh293 [Fistulifera solaris]|eukprot:GAX09338.1 hypothetical protein FisN_6Lh293 [Fistulifera solaris]